MGAKRDPERDLSVNDCVGLPERTPVKLTKSNAPSVISELEEVAGKLGVSVRYAAFRKGDFRVRSGSCVMRGESLIIIDRMLTPMDQADVLLAEMLKYPLERHYISPRLRALLESAQPLQLA